MSLYTISLTLESDDAEAPDFSLNAGALTRAQLDGFLCLTGGFYDGMVASTEDTTAPKEDPDPNA